MSPYPAVMHSDPFVLDRIFDRLGRTLSAGGPDQLRAPFTVGDIMHSLVPYRTYRHELQVDTLQDYEHALLELLSGERSLLVCDADTVAMIRKELASPDPDTGILRRLQTVQVRMGAIRMPVLDVISPIAWPDEDAPLSTRLSTPTATLAYSPELPTEPPPPETTPLPGVVSDAIAIGGALERDRQDDDARAAAPAPITPSELPPVPPAPVAAITPVAPMASVAPTAPVAPMATVAPAAPLTTATPPVASTFARLRPTPIGVSSVYGDPIGFRGLRHAPVDVGGVIFLFGMVARELGFNVEAMSSGFPRCEAKRQIAPGRWTRVRIDFEVESRHFHDAGRSAAACDLLICWRDTWPDRPATLDVLSLEQVLPTLAPQE